MKYRTLLCGIFYASAAMGSPENTLSLEQALARAQAVSPAIRAANLNARAAEKATDAAGQMNNPELFLDAEGLGGELDLYNKAEYTFGLQQTFLRGNKRNIERKSALLESDKFACVAQEQVRQLTTNVRRAFFEVQALQNIVPIQSELLELGELSVETARQRFMAGAGSELEVAQAELSLEESRLEQRHREAELREAKVILSTLIDLPIEELPPLADTYDHLIPFAPFSVDDSHPTLKRLAADVERLRTDAERSRAQDRADLTFGAGVRHDAAADENSFVLSFSMPLSMNHRGQKEYAAGILLAEAALANREAVRRELQQALDQTMERHKAAVERVSMIQHQLIPKAEKAYDLTMEGYEAGRYSWIEQIEAQQHWTALRIRRIEALLAVQLLETELLKFRGNQL